MTFNKWMSQEVLVLTVLLFCFIFSVLSHNNVKLYFLSRNLFMESKTSQLEHLRHFNTKPKAIFFVNLKGINKNQMNLSYNVVIKWINSGL